MMRLFDERRIVVEAYEQLCGARDDAIEQIDADREVRAKDERAILCCNQLPYVLLLVAPDRRADDDGHVCLHTRGDVVCNCARYREINRGTKPTQARYDLFRILRCIARCDDERNLVPFGPRAFFNEPAHRAMT